MSGSKYCNHTAFDEPILHIYSINLQIIIFWKTQILAWENTHGHYLTQINLKFIFNIIGNQSKTFSNLKTGGITT